MLAGAPPPDVQVRSRSEAHYTCVEDLRPMVACVLARAKRAAEWEAVCKNLRRAASACVQYHCSVRSAKSRYSTDRVPWVVTDRRWEVPIQWGIEQISFERIGTRSRCRWRCVVYWKCGASPGVSPGDPCGARAAGQCRCVRRERQGVRPWTPLQRL